MIKFLKKIIIGEIVWFVSDDDGGFFFCNFGGGGCFDKGMD